MLLLFDNSEARFSDKITIFQSFKAKIKGKHFAEFEPKRTDSAVNLATTIKNLVQKIT